MEQCEFPRCRHYPALKYIGHDICDIHWEQLCLADSNTEKRMLKKIKLFKNDQGVVIHICK